MRVSLAARACSFLCSWRGGGLQVRTHRQGFCRHPCLPPLTFAGPGTTRHNARAARRKGGPLVVRRTGYGVVVDSVNVSVLLYAPVRSGSSAPIGCLSAIVTASLAAGPV